MNSKLMLSVLIGIAVVASAVAIAQQVKKAGKDTITAQSMEYDWGANVIEFKGNVRVAMSREFEATMTAPSMTVKLSPKADRVQSVTANGPVDFSILTKADANGQRRKIVATAKQQATYADDTQIVKLVGEATADLLPLEGAEGADAIHFNGQAITANLKTSRLTVDDANLTVETKAQ